MVKIIPKHNVLEDLAWFSYLIMKSEMGLSEVFEIEKNTFRTFSGRGFNMVEIYIKNKNKHPMATRFKNQRQGPDWFP